jgi:hypothetical protein
VSFLLRVLFPLGLSFICHDLITFQRTISWELASRHEFWGDIKHSVHNKLIADQTLWMKVYWMWLQSYGNIQNETRRKKNTKKTKQNNKKNFNVLRTLQYQVDKYTCKWSPRRGQKNIRRNNSYKTSKCVVKTINSQI